MRWDESIRASISQEQNKLSEVKVSKVRAEDREKVQRPGREKQRRRSGQVCNKLWVVTLSSVLGQGKFVTYRS